MIKDHNGKVYETFKDMCKEYNISSVVVRRRLSQGWSLKNALTQEIKLKHRDGGD